LANEPDISFAFKSIGGRPKLAASHPAGLTWGFSSAVNANKELAINTHYEAWWLALICQPPKTRPPEFCNVEAQWLMPTATWLI